ncbi:MAG: hypothetical protein FJW39_06285 [Acidobacteria bacterium]|nr:hypothetical protein [Acidobacteriota bacterium]
MSDFTPDTDALLMQFNKLMQDLLRGSLNRNTFRPWEIDLLLDIEGCNLRDANRREILRRYQKAVQRNVDRGSTSLLKLSEYLERNRVRRERRAAESGGAPVPAAVGRWDDDE